MSFDKESSWHLDLDDPTLDDDNNYSPLSGSTPSTVDESSNEEYRPLLHKSVILNEKLNMQAYLHDISKLNNDIEEFSKIIQTLALFKYYIRNRKNNTNINELNKRFNTISSSCSVKIRIIQEQLARLNHDNHYIMVHSEQFRFTHSDLRERFNIQDSSVKKLKILLDTYHSVIKEYTSIAKKIFQNNETNSSILDEINTKAEDIMILEKNAKDLSDLFSKLNNIIKKRGDNISNLEHQIMLSAEQIERGRDDMAVALKEKSSIQSLYWMCMVIALGTCFLMIPSQLRSLVFGNGNLN